jgi:hypothetical protein
MKFEDVFHNELLTLPKSVPESKSFFEYVKELLHNYILLLESVKQKKQKIEGLKKEINLDNVIPIQKEFVDGLINTLQIYYDGKPAQAYENFSKTIKSRTRKYKELLNTNYFAENESFYRIRTRDENFPFNSNEMFHIPFELRGIVTTQRYSIPGFPSLYLGKTLYIAWEELQRPRLESFQAVRLKSMKRIKYLDLTANEWGDNNLNKLAYKYLMTWPLIAVCSIKVKTHKNTFKEEYIVPQLLLQWVRNNKDIDAVKYNSTHIENRQLKCAGGLYNIVLPVKEIKDKGYCSHLVELFETTETISKQLVDLSTGGGVFLYNTSEIKLIDSKMPYIEIIKGQKSPYSQSVLGSLEYKLDLMKTKKII